MSLDSCVEGFLSFLDACLLLALCVMPSMTFCANVLCCS